MYTATVGALSVIVIVGCGGASQRASVAHIERSTRASPAISRETCRWEDFRGAVYFAPGSSEIDPSFQPEAVRDTPDNLAKAYRAGRFKRLRAWGYVEYLCASAPSDPELARERAAVVLRRLAELGVPRDAMLPPTTLPVCCIEADDLCDPDVPHPLRVVMFSVWRCRDEGLAPHRPR